MIDIEKLKQIANTKNNTGLNQINDLEFKYKQSEDIKKGKRTLNRILGVFR